MSRFITMVAVLLFHLGLARRQCPRTQQRRARVHHHFRGNGGRRSHIHPDSGIRTIDVTLRERSRFSSPRHRAALR
jgi:hypothetical protein